MTSSFILFPQMHIMCLWNSNRALLIITSLPWQGVIVSLLIGEANLVTKAAQIKLFYLEALSVYKKSIIITTFVI